VFPEKEKVAKLIMHTFNDPIFANIVANFKDIRGG